MKKPRVVILCGGMGTRLAEETSVRPKPMVAIGDKPILWHIMNWYAHHGFNDFVLPLGYRGEDIKNYFLNYSTLASDWKVDLASGHVEYLSRPVVDWKVQLSDTGQMSMTGGRLLRLAKDLKGRGTFMLTYGDGLCNVNVNELLKFHRSHGKIATVTAVRPTGRFGTMVFGDNDYVADFREKHATDVGWINGGYFVFEDSIFDYLTDDSTILEADPMERLAHDQQLVGFKHHDFWQCMDTLRDKHLLEQLWNSGDAPWRVL